jgi:uncharacterized membrane protein
MGFSRGVYKLLSALVLLTLLFGAYGVSELREAWRYGTSTHDGVEALVVGAFFLAILVVVVRLKRKRRPGGFSGETPRP